MPNEPAEDRSVRGNTIKPAKVEPEQDITLNFTELNVSRATATVPANGSETVTLSVSRSELIAFSVVTPNARVSIGDGTILQVEHQTYTSLDVIVNSSSGTDTDIEVVVLHF